MTELVPASHDAMHARRHPGAIALLFVFEAVLGAALAWPFASIAGVAYGSHPRADGVLWDPGGLSLLDLMTRRLPELGSLIAHGATVTLLAAIAGIVPSAAFLACLAFTTPDRRSASVEVAVQAGVAAFVTFAAFLAVTFVLQGSLVLSAATIAGLAREGFSRALGDAGSGIVGVTFLASGVALAAFAGVVQDVARASVVRFGLGFSDALRLALRTLGPSPVRLFWAWAWRGLASLAPVAVAGLVADRIGGRGGGWLVAMFVVHQAAVAARVAFRASWLAKAMRVADRAGKPLPART